MHSQNTLVENWLHPCLICHRLSLLNVLALQLLKFRLSKKRALVGVVTCAIISSCFPLIIVRAIFVSILVFY